MELLFFIAIVIFLWAWNKIFSGLDDHEITKRTSPQKNNNSARRAVNIVIDVPPDKTKVRKKERPFSKRSKNVNLEVASSNKKNLRTNPTALELTESEKNEIYRAVAQESADRQKSKNAYLEKVENELFIEEKNLQGLKDRLAELENKYIDGNHNAYREIRDVVGPAIGKSKRKIPGMTSAVKKVRSDNQSSQERESETRNGRSKFLLNSAVEKKREEQRVRKMQVELKRRQKENALEQVGASKPDYAIEKENAAEKEGWQLGTVRKTEQNKDTGNSKNLEKVRGARLREAVLVNNGSHGTATSENRIRQFVKERGIKKLVHFSPSKNVFSILEHGLLPRASLDSRKIVYKATDEHRFDKRTNSLSLSVEYPNHKMLALKRHEISEFSVFFLNPSILWEKECAFFQSNAASMRNAHLAKLKGSEALRDLYEKSSRKVDCPFNCPSDLQAEIMVFDRIETKYVLEIHTDHKLQPADTVATFYHDYGIKVVPNSTVAFRNRPDWKY